MESKKTNVFFLMLSRLLGRHPVGGKIPAVTAGYERHAVGTSHDGQERGEELPVEQALRQRHLPGAVRMRRPVELLRLHVSMKWAVASRH